MVEEDLLIDLVESVMPINNLPSLISASNLNSLILAQQAPLIIDIRASNDYGTGHIPGAVNVAWADLFTYVETNATTSDEIVLVCYTGQSAAFGTGLLRMSGYTNAKSLAFGMSSWHEDFDSWTGNVSTYYYTFLETQTNSKPAEGSLPEISTGFDDAEDILSARIAAVFAEGFTDNSVGASTVTNTPSNYFIVNYWPEAKYLDPGHIEGAVNYDPEGTNDLLSTDYLKTLPTDEKVVVYCYTGQGSAFAAAYLNVLGYDALSLRFGANAMMHGNVPGTNWDAETMIINENYEQ